MLAYEDQERMRSEAMNEAGTEPECPFCHRPRVRRSDYIRCNRCGTNWQDGEDITRDPRIMRHTEFLRQATKPIAQIAESTSE